MLTTRVRTVALYSSLRFSQRSQLYRVQTRRSGGSADSLPFVDRAKSISENPLRPPSGASVAGSFNTASPAFFAFIIENEPKNHPPT